MKKISNQLLNAGNSVKFLWSSGFRNGPGLWVQKSKFLFLTISGRKNYKESKEFLKYFSDIAEPDFNKNPFSKEEQFFNLF